MFGYANEYPIRIDCDKKNIQIMFGAEITSHEEYNLKKQNVIANELGVIKKIQLKDLLEHNQENRLIIIVDDMTHLLKNYKIKPIKIRTTSA